MTGRHTASGMDPADAEYERRGDDRAARLRRERVRVHRQRVVLAASLVALAVLGTAFALRAALVPAPPTATADTIASPAATKTADASAAVKTPAAAETTARVPTTPAASTAATAALKPLSPAPGIKAIVLDRSEQHVTLYKADGAPVDRFPCATGTYYPRVGSYEVFGHDEQSWSLTDNTTFFYFTKFTKSAKGTTIGFHSIPENPDGSLVGGLGKPDSHGCVRLAMEKARFLYTWAVTGTKVVVRK